MCLDAFFFRCEYRAEMLYSNTGSLHFDTTIVRSNGPARSLYTLRLGRPVVIKVGGTQILNFFARNSDASEYAG